MKQPTYKLKAYKTPVTLTPKTVKTLKKAGGYKNAQKLPKAEEFQKYIQDTFKNTGEWNPKKVRETLKTKLKGKELKEALDASGSRQSFPGVIKNSKSGYPDGTPGMFVKSIKGMPGKHYIQHAYDKTLSEMNQ